MTNIEKYNAIFQSNLIISEICLCDEVLTYHKLHRWTKELHKKIISDLEATFHFRFDPDEVSKFINYSTGIAIMTERGIDMSV